MSRDFQDASHASPKEAPSPEPGQQQRGELLSVPCHRTLNLLAHAQMEELNIGSLCGGHGYCGGDRIQIPHAGQKLSPVTDKEREHLSPEELRDGWRLGCQCWPEKADLDILVWVPQRKI